MIHQGEASQKPKFVSKYLLVIAVFSLFLTAGLSLLWQNQLARRDTAERLSEELARQAEIKHRLMQAEAIRPREPFAFPSDQMYRVFPDDSVPAL